MPPSEGLALWRASAESVLKFPMTPDGYCHVFMGKFEKKMQVIWESQMPVGALALILEMSYLFFLLRKKPTW